MALGISAYRQAGDTIEDADVDDNADIQISKLGTRTLIFSFPAPLFQRNGSGVITAFTGIYGGVVLPDANDGDMWISFPVPDEWVSGGDITVRIWWLTAATAGDIKFFGKLQSTTKDGTPANEEIDTVVDTAKGTTNLINTATIVYAAADFAVGDVIGFNLNRTPADGSDTLAADAQVLCVDFEFTGRG